MGHSALMDRQRVDFVKIEHSFELVQIKDRYEFSAARKWPWLQRICFGILNWLGANAEDTVEVFSRVKQENDDILVSLFGQQGIWLERAYREKCRIYMGPGDYKKLMVIAHKNGMRPFDLDAGIQISTPENRVGTWCSIPITVIPWMDGAVLVPDKSPHQPTERG